MLIATAAIGPVRQGERGPQNETAWRAKNIPNASDIFHVRRDDGLSAKSGRSVVEANGPAEWCPENSRGLPHRLQRPLHAWYYERYSLICWKVVPLCLSAITQGWCRRREPSPNRGPVPLRNNVLSQQPPTLTVSKLKKAPGGDSSTVDLRKWGGASLSSGNALPILSIGATCDKRMGSERTL
jgi:hypothetical protein